MLGSAVGAEKAPGRAEKTRRAAEARRVLLVYMAGMYEEVVYKM